MTPYRKNPLYEHTRPYAEAPEGFAVPGDGGRSGLSGKEQIERALDILVRRKWAIILSFVLISAGAAAYTFTRVPEYTTNSIVMLDLQTSAPQSSVPVSGDLFATNGRSLTGELFVIQNSYTIAQRVSERLRQMRQDSLAAGSAGSPQVPYQPQGYTMFSPASREVNAIRITAVSPVPEEAALLANLYAEEYVRITQEASRSYMAASRSFLEEQEKQRREELRQAEERIAGHLKSGGTVGLSQTSASLVGNIAALEAERDNARIELHMQQSSLQAAQNELDNISPHLAQRIASGVERQIQINQEKMAALEIERKNILSANPTEAQQVRAGLLTVEEQMRQLQDEIDQLAREYVREVTEAGGLADQTGVVYVAELKRKIVEGQISINGLKARIAAMEQRIREYEAELQRIPEQSIEMARLERTKQHAEQMYQFVVQRLQETRIAEESEPGYARVLRQAPVPVEPMGPDHKKHLILGIFFGLMVGIGLALAWDAMDNRVYKVDELRAHGYNVLSTIPNMAPLIKEDLGGNAFVEQDGRRFATTLVSMINPMSAITEAYRHLRTSVQFSRPDTVIQTILVTSPGMGEGKSTTAANLAITMAQAGRRTLLIDADMRRPRQHVLFGQPRQEGLAQLLLGGDVPLANCLKQGVEGVDLLVAGDGKVAGSEAPEAEEADGGQGEESVVFNPAELLGSRVMRELLETLRKQYDVIIVDTPPVLAAVDAMLVSTQCDATILVTCAGKTKEAEIEHSLENLESVGAKVIGLLLNGFELSMAYSHRYKYQNYSKYGHYGSYGYSAYTDKKKSGKSRVRDTSA